jgi:hypothetical protein
MGGSRFASVPHPVVQRHTRRRSREKTREAMLMCEAARYDVVMGSKPWASVAKAETAA